MTSQASSEIPANDALLQTPTVIFIAEQSTMPYLSYKHIHIHILASPDFSRTTFCSLNAHPLIYSPA